MNNIIISPSILSADFSNLERDIKKVEPYVPWIHIDVMDGHFVPNITIGVPVVESIRKVTKLFLDTHLMIDNPYSFIDIFSSIGADLITFHYEAALDKTLQTIEKIKNNNKKAGLSIKPDTKVDEIEQYINKVDLILIMTVEPGFGGQKFIESQLSKIEKIKKIAPPDLIIQVDGGINNKTAKLCINKGANSLVSGSYIYKSANIKQAIEALS